MNKTLHSVISSSSLLTLYSSLGESHLFCPLHNTSRYLRYLSSIFSFPHHSVISMKLLYLYISVSVSMSMSFSLYHPTQNHIMFMRDSDFQIPIFIGVPNLSPPSLLTQPVVYLFLISFPKLLEIKYST